jgi:hypothetical protein
MGIVVDQHQGLPPGEDDIIAMMRADGLSPHAWGNAPGDTYGRHEHGYERCCIASAARIVFHTGAGDADLGPGDRLLLPPHTLHAATVGAEGVRCVEAARQG